MSLAARIRDIIFGVVLIILGIIFFLFPEEGYWIVAGILGVSLALYGIHNLIFYFSMARHMVGGRRILYFGVLMLDAGGLLLVLYDMPPFYIMIYLIVIRLVTGVIDFLRAFEQKGMGIKAWKWRLLSGIIHVLLAIACAVFIKSANVAVYIYAASLIYAALIRIITAIKTKNAIIIL